MKIRDNKYIRVTTVTIHNDSAEAQSGERLRKLITLIWECPDGYVGINIFNNGEAKYSLIRNGVTHSLSRGEYEGLFRKWERVMMIYEQIDDLVKNCNYDVLEPIKPIEEIEEILKHHVKTS